MKNLKFIKSIIIVLLFVIGIYFITQNHKVSTDLDTSKVLQNQEEYESIVVDYCTAAQQEYKKQYNEAVSKCDKDTACIENTKNLGDGDNFIPTCIQATIWNDEMSEEEIIKGYAEQTQFSIYVQQAKVLSNQELTSELKQGLITLNTDRYITNLALQMSADLGEYQERQLTDSAINYLTDSMIDKFSPCWGIPVGQCRE